MEGSTRTRKTTEMRKKKLAKTTACRLVDVARLMSTPGVEVGVNVRSDEPSSGRPATPFGRSSFWAFCSCLRAASDLKVGRTIERAKLSFRQRVGEAREVAVSDDEVGRKIWGVGGLGYE